MSRLQYNLDIKCYCLSVMLLLWYRFNFVFIGLDDKGDVTISMKDNDLSLLLAGKLAPQQAYFQGRLKIKGNMGLAMKLQQLMKSNAAQIKAKL